METRSRTTPGPASVSEPGATPIGPAGSGIHETSPPSEQLGETAESLRARAEAAIGEAKRKAKTNFQEARHQLRERFSRGEEFIREHPTEAAYTGIGAGFLLAQLPLRYLAAALIRLTVTILKPAAILYGLVRLADEFRGTAPSESESAQNRSS